MRDDVGNMFRGLQRAFDDFYGRDLIGSTPEDTFAHRGGFG